jgi:hypothetical protein
MAARKSFLQVAPVDAEFERMLEQAAHKGVTEEDLQEQRVSFAYGNAPAGSKNTKDSVREASKQNLLMHA